MTGGYIIDRFMSGMNIVYGLGWKASKRIKIPPVELGKWREAGAWYRIKDIFIGANNSWSFIIAFNFYCMVINISGKQLDIFYLPLLLNTFNVQIWNITKCKLLFMHIPRSAFIKVWNCLSNVLCISIFNWSDLCVWNKIEPSCCDLGNASFFWVCYFPFSHLVFARLINYQWLI